MAGALSKLVNLTCLDLGGRWNVEWVVSCVYVVCRICGGTRDVADVGDVWGSDNRLGADGAAAVAGALSKLVNLTNLYLEGTWECGVGVVCCVYVLDA
mgnify:CR=1 FL=1